MATLEQLQLANDAFFEQISTPGLEKQAIDAVNDFTRTKIREDGFYRRLIPPLKIENRDLDRQSDTDKPVKIVDREPDSPAAVTLPFGSLPSNVYIRGPRYRVMFSRIVTPRYMKDVDELRTWVMDIRQVISDNSLKDVLAQEDSKLIAGINRVLLGPDVPIPHNGNSIQWKTLYGGITRETVQEARKIMPSTPAHLETHTAVINNVTIKEFEKWGRDEMGGDYSQDVIKNGWAEANFMNMQWLITIKRDLVPDSTMFMLADPKFIGKSYLLEDTTMYIRREAFMMEFFAYQTMGGAIGNVGGLARADFA